MTLAESLEALAALKARHAAGEDVLAEVEALERELGAHAPPVGHDADEARRAGAVRTYALAGPLGGPAGAPAEPGDALAGVASNAFSAGGPSPADNAAPPALRQLQQRLTRVGGMVIGPAAQRALDEALAPFERVRHQRDEEAGAREERHREVLGALARLVDLLAPRGDAP